MAVRAVLTLPDRRLKQQAVSVTHQGLVGQGAQDLATDLVETMRASPGCVGLAATQIGVGLAAFVVDVTGHPKAASCHGEFVLFDPVVLEAHGFGVAREGCLSVPALTGDVGRPDTVVVQGWSPGGQGLVIRADAFEARAILHELDHLKGTLFLDRVTSSDSVFRRRIHR